MLHLPFRVMLVEDDDSCLTTVATFGSKDHAKRFAEENYKGRTKVIEYCVSCNQEIVDLD